MDQDIHRRRHHHCDSTNHTENSLKPENVQTQHETIANVYNLYGRVIRIKRGKAQDE
jgi:hypothetical protein